MVRTVKDKKDLERQILNRAEAIKAMTETDGWKILEEEIRNKTRKYRDIRSIRPAKEGELKEQIMNQYLYNRSRADSYDSILIKVKSWIRPLIEEEKHGERK